LRRQQTESQQSPGIAENMPKQIKTSRKKECKKNDKNVKRMLLHVASYGKPLVSPEGHSNFGGEQQRPNTCPGHNWPLEAMHQPRHRLSGRNCQQHLQITSK
jgi:hypothetical protein